MKESSFWEIAAAKVLSTYAMATFGVLWVGFVIALISNRAWLDQLWNWVQTLPSIFRIAIWVFFLPHMVGLWIWQSSWPILGRILGFVAILGWTAIAVYNFIKAFR